MVDASYKMLWREDIPVISRKDVNGLDTSITVVAGDYKGISAVPPTPHSWANDSDNNVAIWIISMEKGSSFVLPAASIGSIINRSLYFFEGQSINVAGKEVSGHSVIDVDGEAEVNIINGEANTRMLLLQGRPINEPVAQHG